MGQRKSARGTSGLDLLVDTSGRELRQRACHGDFVS